MRTPQEVQVIDAPQGVVDAIFSYYEKRGFEPSPAEREVLLNFFEEISGARMTPAYIRVGGVMRVRVGMPGIFRAIETMARVREAMKLSYR